MRAFGAGACVTAGFRRASQESHTFEGRGAGEPLRVAERDPQSAEPSPATAALQGMETPPSTAREARPEEFPAGSDTHGILGPRQGRKFSHKTCLPTPDRFTTVSVRAGFCSGHDPDHSPVYFEIDT